MAKFYRVKKDTFMWNKGAILEIDDGRVRAISDLWDKVELNNEYISEPIVTDKGNADFFERVYEISVLGKTKYLTKQAAQTAHDELYKTKGK